jgi:twitching motility protein PilT
MALFQSESKEVLRKLSAKDFSSSDERDQLLDRLASLDGIGAREIVWMLFRPDRAYRDAAAKVLLRIKDPLTLDAFVSETKGKPEPVVRGAAAVLFTLPLAGFEQRLGAMLTAPEKETQDIGRRLLLEAPPSKSLEPLLWQLTGQGRTEERLAAINRLSGLEIDAAAIPRWQKLVRDGERQIRDKVLEILAQRAPAASVDLLVEQLPAAAYATQQVLVEALGRCAAAGGVEFARRLLPLLASGDAGTRSAVLKILLSAPDRRAIIKEYVIFSRTIAGWARERALDSMKGFGDEVLEAALELLDDPDDEVRASAMSLASGFDDPRLVAASIRLLKDDDWWIRITAVESLGRMKDPQSVPAIIEALNDQDVRWAAVEALGRIGDPRALPALGKLLADPKPDIRIEVLSALTSFDHPQVPVVLQKVAGSDPSRAVRARALDAAREYANRSHTALENEQALQNAAMTATSAQGDPKLHAYLVATRNQAASDFHLSVSQPPIIRVAAELRRAQGEPFTSAQTEAMLREILTDAQWERLQSDHQLDFCYYIPQAGRYRANVFIDQKGYNAVFRVIPEKPPTIAEIGLPSHLAEIADYHQGLVLVCGPSGSGKSTTLAALVNLFNETRHDHVLTMEDPVEFVHPFKNCLINQREVGTHTGSFARALRAALREDPDVIVIGELRDPETIELALTAAETGHIVLGTLNSTSAPKAIDRIISSFPIEQQAQIRTGLSESLKYVLAQRLLPGRQAHQQVACYEVLKCTTSISNMIRDEKTFQIQSAMQIGRAQGMMTVDEALRDLLKREKITAETAYLASVKKEDFEPFVSPEFLETQSFV